MQNGAISAVPLSPPRASAPSRAARRRCPRTWSSRPQILGTSYERKVTRSHFPRWAQFRGWTKIRSPVESDALTFLGGAGGWCGGDVCSTLLIRKSVFVGKNAGEGKNEQLIHTK